MTDTLDASKVRSYARLRVDLGALVSNLSLLARAASPAKCGAVVKADAYGLGMIPVSRALYAAKCRQFFVSEVYEGVALRQSLAQAEIYLFSGVTDETAADCLRHGLIPVLSSHEQIDLWSKRANGRPAAVKIDTGMTRLGLPWDGVTQATLSGINTSLLMTHLACADTPAHPLNDTQLQRFARVRAAFPDTPTSIGNSAGTLSGEATRGELCRCGIGLYGGNPFSRGRNPFQAVAHLEGQVLQIKNVAGDEHIGYGASFQVSGKLRLAIVGLGYANGLPRALSSLGEASFEDQACPIIGRISMNLTAIAVPENSTLGVGDWVQFIGASRTLDEVAALTGTIGYEILTGLKAPRHYQT